MIRGKYLYVVVLAVLFFLAGCVSSVPEEPKVQKSQEPAWVLNPQTNGVLRAVGSSPVNFQGVYMQRSEAMANARDKLSHVIHVYITSIFESRLEENGAKLSRQSTKTITEMSKLFMKESYQVDGYVADDGRLYLLVEISDDTIAPLLKIDERSISSLPVLKTVPYDAAVLEQSRCYDMQTLQSIKTVSGIYRGKPFWFYRPNQEGMIGSVGIAEKEENIPFQTQKRIAISLAKSSLAKRIRLQIDSSHQLTKILKHDDVGVLIEKQMHTKSVSKITQTELKDIWMDPKSCELYVWMVKK
ncbi:MAG: hypothetical protein DRG24_06770 [Epsilonproteobacteria bacterium]|nr:MAG: hypothetical protein DRG24_06770 [Campylobacterota bacterium]